MLVSAEPAELKVVWYRLISIYVSFLYTFMVILVPV